MWPWKLIIRYTFYSVLALYTLLEVTESRDGMFQEVGKVAERVKEKKLAKAKKKVEEEMEKRQARLANKQALLEEARARVMGSKRGRAAEGWLVDEEEEEEDPFLPLANARGVLEKMLAEAEAGGSGGAEAAGSPSQERVPETLTVTEEDVPQEPREQRSLLAKMMLVGLLKDEEVKQHLAVGRVLHGELAAAAADWAEMLDDEEVEMKMEELRQQLPYVATA